MSAYEGGQNFQPDIPAERWKELYLEAAAENERLRELLKRIERNPENVACNGPLLYDDLRAAIAAQGAA